MENCVAEPEEPPLSAADTGDHRHQPPTPRPPSPPVDCLFSQWVNAASWMLDCRHRVYMHFLVWVVSLFFTPRALPA